MLNRWGLFNKRLEMLEFISEKPSGMDEKFGNYYKIYIHIN